MQLSDETLSMKAKTRATLTAMIYPMNADDQTVVWASSDPSVATVDENGTVTAIRAGTAQITAQAGGITATCTVAVEKDIFSVAAGLLGDVNSDGAINQYDYILVKRHYFGTRYLTETEMLPADVNKDGKVDQYDYILICRHYFGTYVIGG